MSLNLLLKKGYLNKVRMKKKRKKRFGNGFFRIFVVVGIGEIR
jgi:hypothetical protein